MVLLFEKNSGEFWIIYIGIYWRMKKMKGNELSVRGYVKPAASFHTLPEWEKVVYQLLELQQDLRDPNEFLDTVKYDLFVDEVFVFF